MIKKIDISLNRQKGQFFISLYMPDYETIDEIKRKNLVRIINQLGKGGQKKLAAMINTEPSYLNNIVKKRRNLSDDMVERICRKLNIELHEFYVRDTTAIPVTNLEHKAVLMVREAEKIKAEQVAEEAINFTFHRLETIKKQERKDYSKSKSPRIKSNIQ